MEGNAGTDGDGDALGTFSMTICVGPTASLGCSTRVGVRVREAEGTVACAVGVAGAVLALEEEGETGAVEAGLGVEAAGLVEEGVASALLEDVAVEEMVADGEGEGVGVRVGREEVEGWG